MGWFAIKTVWFKELVDTVRDKRTLYVMVLLPLVLMPALFVAGPALMSRQAAAWEETLPKALFVGGPEAAELAEAVSRAGIFEAAHANAFDSGAAEDAVRAKTYDLVVFAAKQGEEGGPADLQVVFESRRGASSSAAERFEAFLREYSAAVAAERLQAMGIAPEMLEPYRLAGIVDVTTEQEIGGLLLGMILPFLIAMWAVMGGMYTAIDVAAGEKERGTLESLLMAPVSRAALVIGKLLAIVTVSLIANLLMIFSMAFSVLYLMPLLMSGSELQLSFRIEPVSLLLLAVLMFFFVLMTSALLLTLSAFGKSFREGQAYTTALTFAVMLPGMYFVFVQEINAEAWAYAVPVFNVLLVFRNLLEGVIDWGRMGITFVSLTVCAALSVYAAFRIFLNERVLFRA